MYYFIVKTMMKFWKNQKVFDISFMSIKEKNTFIYGYYFSPHILHKKQADEIKF